MPSSRLAVRWTLRCCSLLGWLAFRTALWQWGTGGTRRVCGLSEVLLYFNYLEEWLTQPANVCTTQVPDAQYPRKNTISSLQIHAWYICRYSQSQDTHTHTLQVNISLWIVCLRMCSISSFCFSFLLTLTIHVWYIFTYLYHLLPLK